MQQQNSGSEVARLRAQIEQEHEAMCSALTGPALGTARHSIITRRMEQIGVYQEQLADLIGEQETMTFLAEVFEHSPEQREETAHE